MVVLLFLPIALLLKPTRHGIVHERDEGLDSVLL